MRRRGGLWEAQWGMESDHPSREAGGSTFEASLVYRASSKTSRATWQGPVSKQQQKITDKTKSMQDCVSTLIVWEIGQPPSFRLQ